MSKIEVNLTCGDKNDEKLILPCAIDISEQGIVFTVEGYEELACVIEYYGGTLQVLIWDEKSALTEEGNCEKVVLSKDIAQTKFNIERQRFWSELNS